MSAALPGKWEAPRGPDKPRGKGCSGRYRPLAAINNATSDLMPTTNFARFRLGPRWARTSPPTRPPLFLRNARVRLCSAASPPPLSLSASPGPVLALALKWRLDFLAGAPELSAEISADADVRMGGPARRRMSLLFRLGWRGLGSRVESSDDC